MSSTSARRYADRVTAFREGLKELGFVENHNVTIEYRWADDHNERLSELAAELVARRVAVIVTGGSSLQRLQQKQRPQQFPSYSRPLPIRSVPASSAV